MSPSPAFRLVLAGVSLVASAIAADAPRPWPADQFLPVTEERIAVLPATERPAWRAYWVASAERSARLPGCTLAENTPLKRIEGPPIPSTYSRGVRLQAPAAWFAGEEAQQIADRVVNWQTVAGGWVKTGDYSRLREMKDEHFNAWSYGTFDNDSTINELRFLALVMAAAGKDGPHVAAWRGAFMRGLDYVLASQFPNGGFPQIYPLVGGYHDAITLNDDAMEHILELLRDISVGKPEFAFVPTTLATEAGRRVERGIQCVLAMQIRGPGGQLTVWGQQHDALTLKPCAARNFEPVAECSNESAHLLQFLMSAPNPSPALVASIEAGMKWMQRRAIHDMAPNRDDTVGMGLVPKPGGQLLWARLYELDTGKPIFGERDRMIHYVFGELTNERRKGYAWYGTWPAGALETYRKWSEQRK
ncbi:MAG: pectate lyase [Verrucomicrobia bacterium]|nr:pectate lyase [Verrucomicrobiota bacterium]